MWAYKCEDTTKSFVGCLSYQVLVQPEMSGLQELDLSSNSIGAGSVHKILNLLTVRIYALLLPSHTMLHFYASQILLLSKWMIGLVWSSPGKYSIDLNSVSSLTDMLSLRALLILASLGLTQASQRCTLTATPFWATRHVR